MRLLPRVLRSRRDDSRSYPGDLLGGFGDLAAHAGFFGDGLHHRDAPLFLLTLDFAEVRGSRARFFLTDARLLLRCGNIGVGAGESLAVGLAFLSKGSAAFFGGGDLVG